MRTGKYWYVIGAKRVVRRLLFFFQAEDGIRDLVRSRGLGDVYKRQDEYLVAVAQAVGDEVLIYATDPTSRDGDGDVLTLSLIHI